ncbi:hypothetical protein HHL21_07275 [Massilia sp. RP-1-19]|uniref:Uncharacterized protein n=1 Tax=Massilia polaris TaxID=2728846 RepID=A0A848HQL2_9BURK|nr:hypothetical protein [Massilia polaris]NML60888.1 hypothetical protein [Massilia polaris]
MMSSVRLNMRFHFRLFVRGAARGLQFFMTTRGTTMRMRMPILMMTTLLTLAACKEPPPAEAAPRAAASASPVLSTQGYGPVRFGAKLSDMEQLLGEKSQPPGVQDPACSSIRFDKLPGVRFMVENGVLTRADADAGLPNELGLAVGDTLEQAKKKHPAIVIGPHKYVPDGHYLTVRGADARTAIVMEDDGKRITKIRAGLEPAVSYVEGCL